MDAVSDAVTIDPALAEAGIKWFTFMIFGGLGFIILRSLIAPSRRP